jgi:hypothetical protein
MFFSDGGHYKGAFENGNVSAASVSKPLPAWGVSRDCSAGMMHGGGVLTQANSVVYCGTENSLHKYCLFLVLNHHRRELGKRCHHGQRG